MSKFLKIEKGEIEHMNFEIKVKPEALSEIITCDCWICEELRNGLGSSLDLDMKLTP